MRSVLFAALLLAAAPASAATTMSLDALAAEIQRPALPRNIAFAPDEITIDPALRDTLLAQTLDGGREQKVYLRFEGGRLSFHLSVTGDRYTASGHCNDCDYPQPIRAHTHPYENPFSVIDLIISGREGRPSMAITRAGQIYLAVPTTGSNAIAIEEWREFRYALFGNRLQCPARTPPGGWAAPTPMGRNVEIVARAAAHDLKVALYVLDPGKTAFRKLEDFDHGERLFATDQPFTVADLNPYEMVLLRTLELASVERQRKLGGWMDRVDQADPRRPSPDFAARLNAPVDPEDDEVVQGTPRNAANIASDTGGFWFRALPTTVYLWPFQDLTRNPLPFVSVQYSGDCRDLMVLQGEQRFAPDSVTYSRGWRRARAGRGAWEEGWSEAAPAHFPAGQVVPW